MKFIFDSLKNPSKIERIFKASDHDYKAKEFHRYCDNIKNTFILVRTEFDKTIGGFTHYPWKESDLGEDVSDVNRRAFLFSLDRKEIYIPQDIHHLIRCSK